MFHEIRGEGVTATAHPRLEVGRVVAVAEEERPLQVVPQAILQDVMVDFLPLIVINWNNGEL